MKKPKYRLFTILSVVFLILGILMTTVGGHFSTVLTVAMEGSTTDKETAEMTYADGLAMNVELEEEGLVLLKMRTRHFLYLQEKSMCLENMLPTWSTTVPVLPQEMRTAL